MFRSENGNQQNELIKEGKENGSTCSCER